MQKLSHKNKFALHKNEHVGGTHFHVNGFARILVLKQKQNVTQKWPMDPSNPHPPQTFRLSVQVTPYNVLPQDRFSGSTGGEDALSVTFDSYQDKKNKTTQLNVNIF